MKMACKAHRKTGKTLRERGGGVNAEKVRRAHVHTYTHTHTNTHVHSPHACITNDDETLQRPKQDKLRTKVNIKHERERDTERDRDRDRETERDRDRQTERQRQRDRDRQIFMRKHGGNQDFAYASVGQSKEN